MSPQAIAAIPRPALTALALIVLAAAAGTLSVEPAAAGQCGNADAGPREITRKQARDAVVCLVNRARSVRGRGRLDGKSSLRRAAGRHSRRMAKRDCFSHRCPGEADLVDRIFGTKYLPCSCAWGIAENIAWGEDDLGTPRKIFTAWMNSAEHRRNILDRDYSDIGIGVAWGSPSGAGHDAATYTTDFGYKR